MTDRRGVAQEDAWMRTPFHRAMLRALADQGYASYEEAVARRIAPDCPVAEKVRFEAFQEAWRVRAYRYAKLDHDVKPPPASRAGASYSAASTTSRLTVKRRAADPEPLPPALVAECRAQLDALMAASVGKSGRKRGPTIKVGVEAAW